MNHLTVNIEKALSFVDKEELNIFQNEIDLHRKNIYNKQGEGNDFLGWVDWPTQLSDKTIQEIEKDAARIKAQSDVVVVIGIGGSYLGTKAVVDALSSNFHTHDFKNNENPLIVYAGHNISEDYMHELLGFLGNQDYSIIVISKSGTTTEPAIAFRILRNHIEKKYREQANERIFAITDAKKGALRNLANEKKYRSYVIPDDIGGRYSVLTPVGLLPIAVAGYDIRALIKGAKQMEQDLKEESDLMKNPAALYALIRNMLYRKGKTTEILANYVPNLMFFNEWWKQLFGESEGKSEKGIFPASVNLTTDLHSMGQYMQEGLRNIFETVLRVNSSKHEIKVPHDPQNLDGLNYLQGKRMHDVNSMAEAGTILAHLDGGVPVIQISIPKLDEYNMGLLVYFFEMSCAISGYLLEVNPFNQPGVEAYKKNMFALLEKPGFEKETQDIKKRI